MRSNIFSVGQNVEGVSSEEILQKAKLDWTVSKTPLQYEFAGETRNTGVMGIIRDDNGAFMGECSPKYKEIQNEFLRDLAVSIVDTGEALWERAGSFQGGRKVFFQMRVPKEYRIESGLDDDTVQPLLTIVSSHDCSLQTLGNLSLNRVWCQNSFNLMVRELKGGQNTFKVKHSKNAVFNLEQARKMLGMVSQYNETLIPILNGLAKEVVSTSYVEQFIAEIVPANGDEPSTRTENKRKEFTHLFHRGTGTRGKTKYDLLNAVTEHIDHYSSGRITGEMVLASDSDADLEAEGRFTRSFMPEGVGFKLRQKAFDLLTA